jgi:hypothetical protein
VEGCVDTVSVEVAPPPLERVGAAGLIETVGPFGETDEERLTVPAKDPRLVSLIVEVPDAPGETCIEEGLDEILKSGGVG